MKKLLFSILFFVAPSLLVAQNYGNALPATDALGRKLPTAEQVGAERQGKYVGLFYWTWHTAFSHLDICVPSRVIAQYPEAAYDYHHPAWDKKITSNFWGEPLFGFYRDTDRWVLRKHAEMLAEAGVDVLFFDCTNGNFTWKESYMALCEEFLAARRDGIKTPQIAFILAFGPTRGAREAILEIYHDLYKPAKYEELFFKWEGKPLIMAYPEMLGEVEGDAAQSALHREVRDYFTFRPPQPLYNTGPQRKDHWGWLEIYPQHGFYQKPDGGFEQATVGVSQNWTKENGLSAMNMKGAFGRSYTAKGGHNYSEGAVEKGLNFQEQWERALEIDPDLIFITGWNEWIMGRFEEWQRQPNAFPDQFDQEHSRDIEPMRGGHGDSYYYQMVTNIRRFKGMPKAESPSAEQRIKIDGEFEEWQSLYPEYRATQGNTLHRDSRGWGDLIYRDSSGRNDIIRAKVARDERNIYFYVECREPIRLSESQSGLSLYLDIDSQRDTGWEGYDYLIGRQPALNKRVGVERNIADGEWKWQSLGDVKCHIEGCAMELALPRKMLQVEGDAELNFEFKWVDNTQTEGDIYDFYLSGDAAPIGRFNFSYKTGNND